MAAKILGLDSSLTAFGWSVLEAGPNGLSYVAGGLLRTAKDHDADSSAVDTTRRVHDIGLEVSDLIERFSPTVAGVEGLALPWGKTSMVTVSTLGRVRGMVDGVCLLRGLEVHEVDPRTLKKFLVGDPNAEKPEVIAYVSRLFPGLRTVLEGIKSKKLHDNPADACGVAMWAQQFVDASARRSFTGVSDGV